MSEPTADTRDFAKEDPSAAEKGQPSPTVTYPPAPAAAQSGLVNRKKEPSSATSPASTAGRTGTMKTGTTVLNTPTNPTTNWTISSGPHPAAPTDAKKSATEAPEGEKRHSKRRFSYWQALMKPPKPVGKTPTVGQSIRAIVFATWLNVLLVFIPVSWALHFAKSSDTVVFVTAFFAIIPLAKLLGFATEELALRVGETLGGLLNATLGNAVELIVSIIALLKCQLRVVQASLIGSILSNLLLVLGMCFFAGGTKFATQGFLISASQLNSSLLTLSVVAILIPATFHAALSNDGNSTNEGELTSAEEGQKILQMSRGVSVILLFIYACNLTYQLWSHAHLYDATAVSGGQKSVAYPESVHLPGSRFRSKKSKEALASATPGAVAEGESNRASMSESGLVPPPNDTTSAHESQETGPEMHVTTPAGEEHAVENEEEEEEEIPQISVSAAIVLLVVVTVLVAVTAEFLVGSIEGLVDNSPLSEEWVGLILLPIVGNAAEHVTAVTVSVKDKLDLSIGVAVGSSIQIALLVIPFIVILSWIVGKPLTLLFDPFEAVVLFLTVITVNYVVADGQSNWLEGMILICLYIIIAVALWFYPGSDPAAALLTCVV